MDQRIVDAVREMRLVQFTYDGHHRIVEAHAYGVTTAGHEAIRCYQVAGSGSDGASTGWHMMLESKVVGLEVLGECFRESRAGYRRGDRGMCRIYCEL